MTNSRFGRARGSELVARVGASALVVGAFALTLGGVACSGAARAEGLDASKIPDSVRGDYEVFARRCSKCHSLARPLESGIEDDGFWALYVARMRRQPASGISPEDAVVILRFLHYYSEEQKRAKGARRETPPAATPPLPPSSPVSPVSLDGGPS